MPRTSTKPPQRRRAAPSPRRARTTPAQPARHARPAPASPAAALSASLAAISHDIRAPLNAIIGMAGLLAETPLAPEQKQYVQVCKSAGESLLALVNDLLDLSRIEAGRLVLDDTEFDVAAVAEDACEVLAFNAQQKGIELTCSIDPAVPEVVMGDLARLRQILVNLVGNAVKYTDEGSVKVEVRQQKSAPESPACTVVLEFSVRDTGIGIPRGKQATIFNRFTQADAAAGCRGGVGLGLTIAHELAVLMQGDIAVHSAPSEGSTFILTARFKLPARECPPSIAHSLAGMRVLVVEPAATHRDIVGASLARAGAQVTAATCRDEAVAALEHARDAHAPFRAVLLDCQALGIEGAALATLLRAGLEPDGRIVMMSGIHVHGLCTERCKLFGPVEVLTKPVRRSRLCAALRGTPAEVKGLHVLLVDDSRDTEPLMRRYLEGCRLDTAVNGADAVEKVKATRFDAVLMDVEMPVMDGHTATRRIRAWERESGTPRTPIIALTAHACPEEAGKCIKAGCDAHLAKPVRKSELLQMLAKHALRAVSAQKESGSDFRSRSPSVEDSPAETPSQMPSATPATSAVLPADPDVQDLVPAFLEHRREDLAALKCALGTGDFATIARRGHIMKGSGTAYGFPMLSELGAAIERAGIAQDAAAAATHIRALEDFLQHTEET